MKNYWILILPLLLLGCQPADSNSSLAQRVIDQAIAAHGGDQLDRARISFDFRKKHYEATLDQDTFRYESRGEDSIGYVEDHLTNQNFSRSVDGQEVTLNAEDEDRYRNALNSVVYFVLLPYPLNDPAVNKTYLGETTLREEPYHKVKVTFDQAGGGDDFDDTFVYWIHQEDHTMDYLAYEFHVNGGGTRFREAYNARTVAGIRFADYINYESTVDNFTLEDYDRLFEEGKVQELSRIKTENIEVGPMKST